VNTSRIVAVSGMTFDDILTEVQTFAYFRNVRHPRRLIRFILLRAGLPNQEHFPRTDMLSEDDLVALTQALGSVDDLADKFFSPHFDDKTEDEQTEPLEATQEEESIETSIPEEPLEDDFPQSERASIWTSDRKIEIVYKFSPENIPQEDAEISIDEVIIDGAVSTTD
jgi:hypothetical protein